MFGGAIIGLLVTPIKAQLGPLANGIVNNEVFLPAPSLTFPGTKELLAKYQAAAATQGIDPGGWASPLGYAAGQVLAQAVEGTKSLDNAKLADYMRSHTFKTVVGDVAFGKDGEWAKSGVSSSPSSSMSPATAWISSRTPPTKSSCGPEIQDRRHDLSLHGSKEAMNGKPFKLGTFAKQGGAAFAAIVLDDDVVDLKSARGGQAERDRQHRRLVGQLGRQLRRAAGDRRRSRKGRPARRGPSLAACARCRRCVGPARCSTPRITFRSTSMK